MARKKKRRKAATKKKKATRRRKLEKISREDLKYILLDEFEENMKYGLGKWNKKFGAWEYIIVYPHRKKFEFDW